LHVTDTADAVLAPPAELRHRDALYHQVEQTGKAQRAVYTLRHIAAAGRQAIDPKGGLYLVD
jgi:hypothetical protein